VQRHTVSELRQSCFIPRRPEPGIFDYDTYPLRYNTRFRFDIHRFHLFASDLDASGSAEVVDAGNGVGRKRRERSRAAPKQGAHMVQTSRNAPTDTAIGT